MESINQTYKIKVFQNQANQLHGIFRTALETQTLENTESRHGWSECTKSRECVFLLRAQFTAVCLILVLEVQIIVILAM